MTPERLQFVRRVFESVIELTSEQRVDALRETEENDPTLAGEVIRLVSAYERRAGFIERPLANVYDFIDSGKNEASVDGITIGPYRLLHLIGEGGMGEVWSAEQTDPVRRRVALKLIKTGMDTREVVARFESERQALALMDHPAIAKVFDAGSTSQGRPYFAMEYVAGVPITTYCEQRRLTIRERLRLFVRVCAGVQHAHQKAIIHRDLKPSNILITELDDKPMPKIIDFGVAKAVSHRLTEKTVFTRVGAILGTPDYMSPEQANSAGEDIDTRTDVYALGVILYELLVGERPFDFRTLTIDAVLERLRNADAPLPSTKFRSLNRPAIQGRSRRTEMPVLMRQLRGDLDAIALKALEKDRSRRYGTPLELAADIERHLKNEPVIARPASIGYQAQRYVRRHSASVAAVSLLILILACFGVTEAIQIRRITRERDRADRVTELMINMFKASNPSESRGNKVSAREILDKASKDLESSLTNDVELKAQMMEVMGTVYYNLGLYSQAEPLLHRAFESRRSVLGPGHLKTAQAASSLGKALDKAGRTADAEKLYREAFAIRQRVLGRDDPATLQSLNNIAVTIVHEGRYAEAEQLHRQILEARRRVLGPEHPDTLTSLDNLGNTLDREGHLAQAEVLEREALQIKQRVLGPFHPETLRAAHHLADTLYGEGRYTDAERLHREQLKNYLRILGPEHPETVGSLLGLANALEGQRRYLEAEQLIRRAIDVDRRVLGPENPETLLAMNNLAEIFGEEGRYRSAEELHRQVIEGRSRVLGPEHAHTLYSKSKLAWVFILSGRYDEAETLSRDVHNMQVRVLGPNHPDTADTTYNLACVAAHQSRMDESLAYLRDAVDHGLRASAAFTFDKDPVLNPLHKDVRFASLSIYARQHAASSLSPR